MKKLCLLILLPFITFAPEQADGEWFFDIINYSSSYDLTFILTAFGARWDGDFELTEDFEIVSENIVYADIESSFDHILHPGNKDEFAIAIYRASVEDDNEVELAAFYLDWRTSNWQSSLDVHLKYDVDNEVFRDDETEEIIDNTIQNMWDLTPNILETSGLEDYWDNCMVLTVDGDDHPRLVWGPHPDDGDEFDVDNYKIYADTHQHGYPPGTFGLLATLDNDDFEYTDESVTVSSSGINDKSYYVKAVYTDLMESVHETDPTNTVTVQIADPFKIGFNNHSEKIGEYHLDQNYPNPFNPTTSINYSIKKDGFVSFNIYDVLGKQVASLVNENKRSGSHSVEFNAVTLPSGIYFYKLTSGQFTSVKKLILMK